jgi:hypothetical protein
MDDIGRRAAARERSDGLIVIRIALCLIFCALGPAVAAQAADGGFFDAVWYPTLRLGADIGFDYGMYATGTGAYSINADLTTEQDWISDRLYGMGTAGIGVVAQAGIEAEFMELWQDKGLFGGEAYLAGGAFGGAGLKQYLVGAGLGCTLFWVGKVLFEFGYSGVLSDIRLPARYLGGTDYEYRDGKAGGFYFACELGIESPVIVVPGLSAFVFYRFFESVAAPSLSEDDYHDYGYWLVRNGLRAGLSYRLGPARSLED